MFIIITIKVTAAKKKATAYSINKNDNKHSYNSNHIYNVNF